MAALKSRISKSGLPVRNYNSIQQLGDMVLRDLKGSYLSSPISDVTSGY